MKWRWICIYFLTATIVVTACLWGSRVVNVLSESHPIHRDHCVVIDAGHGGIDGGAISCTGRSESTYNLDISLRLNDLFRLLGYDTRMIRTTDTSVHISGDSIAQKKSSDLKQRVHLVNETEAAVLISIHQNFFSDSQYSGAQVFYGSREGSQILAETIQQTFLETVNTGSHREIKKGSGIYLLEHVKSPAVLVECGFLSNLEEEAKLRNPNYQKRLCCVIASATSSFLSNT